MSFSVLMSVYKKENSAYLDIAIKSIWDDQTLKPNEIILVQDGELTEALYKVIAKWKAKLNDILTIVDLNTNIGFAKALNEGLKHCSYELVARMDTDDVALPDRFKKQIYYMEAHKDIAVCGSFIQEMDENNQIRKTVSYPINSEEIKQYIKLKNPLCHPSVVFRKSIIEKVGGYPDFRLGQDFALWSLLLSKNYKLVNISEVLLQFRVGNDLYKRRSFEDLKYMIKIYKYQYRLGIINFFELNRNILLKAIVNLSPLFIKKLLYKLK